jgi:hypothetical protein
MRRVRWLLIALVALIACPRLALAITPDQAGAVVAHPYGWVNLNQAGNLVIGWRIENGGQAVIYQWIYRGDFAGWRLHRCTGPTLVSLRQLGNDVGISAVLSGTQTPNPLFPGSGPSPLTWCTMYQNTNPFIVSPQFTPAQSDTRYVFPLYPDQVPIVFGSGTISFQNYTYRAAGPGELPN